MNSNGSWVTEAHPFARNLVQFARNGHEEDQTEQNQKTEERGEVGDAFVLITSPFIMLKKNY